MNNRERMLATLEGRPPDRIPWIPRLLLWYTAKQRAGALPAEWAALTVEAQLEDIYSTLSLYRQAIELRYARLEFSGDTVEWYGAPDGCLAFRRAGGLICALNASPFPVPLPPGQILLVSTPLEAGLKSVMGPTKGNFIGRNALVNQPQPQQLLVGLQIKRRIRLLPGARVTRWA